MEYVIYILAFFFAGGWTYGLFTVSRPYHIVVTVIYWWIFIGCSIGGYYSYWHLLWLMPVALFINNRIFYYRLKKSGSLFEKSGSLFGPSYSANLMSCFLIASTYLIPCIIALIYFSN